MKRLHVMFGILIVLFSVPSAMAISVDGTRGAGEWDENWAYGQAEGSGYSAAGPFGDKMVVFQNGNWYDEDPITDSGTLFNENMATAGSEESGYDLKGLYARYDPVSDVLYGMSTVYGLPGDLDGDGSISSLASNGDTVGPVTGKPINGVGNGEQFSIVLTQGSKSVLILISGNEWTVSPLSGTFPGFSEANVNAAASQTGDAVYEIAITGLKDQFNLVPGEGFEVKVTAGGNLDIPGEDQARIFFTIPNPDIDIEKATNGFDADNPTGPELSLGDAVTWTYVVTNTGDVPLENVVVTDDMIGAITNIVNQGNGDDTLGVGEVWTYEATGTAECGQYENLATVNADWLGIPVTDEDPSHYIVRCEPDIDIEKHTNGQDADYPAGPQIEVGETITWEYFVTNTGNVALYNVVVEDDKIGIIGNDKITDKGNGDDVLDIGETWTYVVTDVLEECVPQYENIADVTGEDETGTTVTDEDPSHFHCQPVVPVLTPVGILFMVGILGALGVVTLRRRD
ncbi:DUF7507 domain-containing protein [Methanolobus bombayensis]|uniref:DUF7507 domain-containing protein n=1 Tax=Methanolobus bombayensis TaxID=38023 RepID=UPI001AEB0FC6|nr:hypothetical protein [Methanolobus bombayensis]MBP1909051.1 putative repeat protein (TIGR01451 family) [Methanolobus bombayensis]